MYYITTTELKAPPPFTLTDSLARDHRYSFRTDTQKAMKPNPGEYWYFKIPGATTLTRGYVKSMSAHTVLITNSKNSYDGEGSRYLISDLQWVEQAQDDDRT